MKSVTLHIKNNFYRDQTANRAVTSSGLNYKLQPTIFPHFLTVAIRSFFDIRWVENEFTHMKTQLYNAVKINDKALLHPLQPLAGVTPQSTLKWAGAATFCASTPPLSHSSRCRGLKPGLQKESKWLQESRWRHGSEHTRKLPFTVRGGELNLCCFIPSLLCLVGARCLFYFFPSLSSPLRPHPMG